MRWIHGFSHGYTKKATKGPQIKSCLTALILKFGLGGFPDEIADKRLEAPENTVHEPALAGAHAGSDAAEISVAVASVELDLRALGPRRVGRVHLVLVAGVVIVGDRVGSSGGGREAEMNGILRQVKRARDKARQDYFRC